MRRQLEDILNLLRAALKGKVKTFYLEKPSKIPRFALPAVYVDVGNVTTRIEDTRDDLVEAQIFVGVCVQRNVGRDMSSEGGDKLFLIELMQGQDKNGDIAANTVYGVMRQRGRRDITNIVTLEKGDAMVDYRTEVDLLSSNEIMAVEASFVLTYTDNVQITNNRT